MYMQKDILYFVEWYKENVNERVRSFIDIKELLEEVAEEYGRTGMTIYEIPSHKSIDKLPHCYSYEVTEEFIEEKGIWVTTFIF